MYWFQSEDFYGKAFGYDTYGRWFWERFIKDCCRIFTIYLKVKSWLLKTNTLSINRVIYSYYIIISYYDKLIDNAKYF